MNTPPTTLSASDRIVFIWFRRLRNRQRTDSGIRSFVQDSHATPAIELIALPTARTATMIHTTFAPDTCTSANGNRTTTNHVSRLINEAVTQMRLRTPLCSIQ